MAKQYRKSIFSLTKIPVKCVLFVSELQRFLRKYYRDTLESTHYIPTRTEKSCGFRDIYVLPKLVKKDHRQIANESKKVNGVTVTTYREIFPHNNDRCRNVFVVGEAGSGKSSFSQHIALLWSEENKEAGAHHQSQDPHFIDVDTIKEFEFVFHVKLRDACYLCDLVEIIRDQLLSRLYTGETEIKKAKDLVENVLNKSRCLILADGRDEWSHPEICDSISCSSEEKKIAPLIHQQSSATVLLTSRPGGFTKFPEHKVDNYIEIEGTQNVQQLGENILKVLHVDTGKKKFDEFETLVKENGLWDNMSQSPIHFIHLICLWLDNHNLSKSVSITYASIFNMLIGRAKYEVVTSQNENLDNEQLKILTDMDNINSNWKQFKELCKLAFEKLFAKDGHSAIVFSNRDCKDDLKTFALKCGILTEKQSNSLTNNSNHLSFQHKTYQEFLASVHLSFHYDLIAPDIKKQYFLDAYNKIDPNESLGMLFVFMCALNGNTAGNMSEYLIGQLDGEDFRGLMSRGFREALYAGNRTIKLECPCGIQIYHPSGTDMQDYIKWMEKNEHGIRYIQLQKPEQNMKPFFSFLQKLPQLQTIFLSDMKLDFQLQLPSSVRNIDLEKVTVTSGEFLLHLTHLKKVRLCKIDLVDLQLKLPNNVITIELDEVTVTRGDFLLDPTQLQKVRLCRIDLGDLQLQLPNSVTHIYLNGVPVTRGDFLLHLKQLQRVSLCYMDLGDLQLQLPNNVTTIDLIGVPVTRKDVLLHLKQLQRVILCYMDLGDLQLQLPSSVTTIDLIGVTVTREDFLLRIKQLQTVRLCKIDLGDLQLQLPSSVTTIELDEVTVTREDFLHHLSQLQTVKLYNMDVGDLQLPSNVTCVDLCKVTVPVEVMLCLVERLEQTTHNVKHYVITKCSISPVDQIKRVNERIQQSTCLKLQTVFGVDNESSVSFTFCK